MDGQDTITRHMHEALALAERGWGHVSPNPMVGALVVDADGEVVGRGWYEGPRGAPHAEVRALQEAGERARGGTLICSLEPCNHHGSTPPCTDALIDAGIASVVVAATDPNPLVDGRGVRRLREAGLQVHTGILAEEAQRLNAAFERHVTTGRPFLIWKVAASLDGKTAARDGSSRWITSPEARADSHRLRAWADAVIVGSGTVLADDPRLTVRREDLADARQPVRVVVDSSPADRPAAERLDHRLVPEADAQRRDPGLGEGAGGLDRDPRLGRRARPGRDHQPVGAALEQLGDGSPVVADHVELRPELTQVLDEVVGERVVVVDHERLHPHSDWASASATAWNIAFALFTDSRYS